MTGLLILLCYVALFAGAMALGTLLTRARRRRDFRSLKTVILITHSVEEALLLGERLLVMAPRPGRIHREYALPFAEAGIAADLREVKRMPEFGERRDEILSMIWEMEEEIMGRTESA
jgi:ABC-type taurine transport system ATPase subunit